MSAPALTKWIYDFAEGSREMRELLGGKGANVAEMTRVYVSCSPFRVPIARVAAAQAAL
jgi:phosphoenolpyruvate synthase/pyruvate phosphate dikinase